MKYYIQHSTARLVVAGLSLACIMTMLASPAYAHGMDQNTTADSYQLGALVSKSYVETTVAVSHQQAANTYKGSIPASQTSYRENCELGYVYDNGEFVEKDNGDNCCHKCENIFTRVPSAAHNKHQDKHIASSAHTEKILPRLDTPVIHTGFTYSSSHSLLQGALRFRILLI